MASVISLLSGEPYAPVMSRLSGGSLMDRMAAEPTSSLQYGSVLHVQRHVPGHRHVPGKRDTLLHDTTTVADGKVENIHGTTVLQPSLHTKVRMAAIAGAPLILARIACASPRQALHITRTAGLRRSAPFGSVSPFIKPQKGEP